MNIYKVLPSLTKDRQMGIWHKALRSQWSAEDIRWDVPRTRLSKPHLRDHLGKILTPILMGEQAALYSVSSLIPVLGHRAEVEGQFYLTTWAVDEARHTELFARYYGRIEREPMSIRRFPSSYLFQSQINSKEPAEWLAGVLVSEVLATLVMKEFERLDLDSVLSEIAHGILVDEARHLGFNHIYLEDRFGDVFRGDAREAEALAQHLRERLDKVLALVDPMLDGVARELEEVGIDRHELLDGLSRESRTRLVKSIEAGRRLAARGGERARPVGADAGREAAREVTESAST